MVGFMSYNGMNDDDISAIISFLRSTPPVRNVVPEHDFNMVGKVLMRFLIEPVLPAVQYIKPDTTAEYGKYLAYNVTNCNGCHTDRGPTGEFIGEPLAGGHAWDLDDATYTAANLTPTILQEESQNGLSMFSFSGFAQDECWQIVPCPDAYKMFQITLTALYRFLNQLPPVHKEIKTYVPKNDVKIVSR